MTRIRRAVGAVAGAVLGQETAAAACAPNGHYDYRCIQGYQYKRYCETRPDCSGLSCGPYSYTGNHC
jgi:hypothetical protein